MCFKSQVRFLFYSIFSFIVNIDMKLNTKSYGRYRHFNKNDKNFKIVLQIRKTFIPLQSQNSRGKAKLRYGVMVALQILALSVRVRVLLSQQNFDARMAG